MILGRATGITNILVWLGLMAEATAYQPSFVAVLPGLSYIAFPYCVLTLFPSLNRVDRELTEAAQTLGASPWRTFWTVVVPHLPADHPGRVPAGVRVHARQQHHRPVLGRPQHWTLSVLISDQAPFNANVPFAAAIAMFLTVLSLLIVGLVILIESRTRRSA